MTMALPVLLIVTWSLAAAAVLAAVVLMARACRERVDAGDDNIRSGHRSPAAFVMDVG